ncbi:DUF7305 domain-containing protein [Desulfitibacter alkalitolerans]|uniref:DUF7305 domain-containing protein n=1 Tax=Desulfitibacter alkalitolerans TaxID=264641 RepID=UPI000485D313|nr:hypothetical protein [Desulfitibacter alkalitolerans]
MFKKNEEGIAMIAAILAVLVLTILGFSLWNYSMAETIQTQREEMRMQAYYIARSGAESVANHLVNQPMGPLKEEIDDAYPNSVTSSVVDMGNGSFIITATKLDSTSVLIESVGTVENVTQKVSITLQGFSQNWSLFEHALLAKGKIALGPNSQVTGGSIATVLSQSDNPIDNKSHNINNDQLLYGVNAVFPPIEIPDTDEYGNAVVYTFIPGTYRPNSNQTINTHTRFNSVDIRGNRIITFDTKGKDLYIFCDGQFSVGGNATINVIGGGRTLIYTSSFDLSGAMSTSGNSGIFVFAYGSGTALRVRGTINAAVAMYADQGTANLNGATATIYGSIVATEINLGNSNVHFTQVNDYGIFNETANAYKIIQWGD